jgi:hypothetical protein
MTWHCSKKRNARSTTPHIVGRAEIADLTRLCERELGHQWEYVRAWLRAEMAR